MSKFRRTPETPEQALLAAADRDRGRRRRYGKGVKVVGCAALVLASPGAWWLGEYLGHTTNDVGKSRTERIIEAQQDRHSELFCDVISVNSAANGAGFIMLVTIGKANEQWASLVAPRVDQGGTYSTTEKALQFGVGPTGAVGGDGQAHYVPFSVVPETPDGNYSVFAYDPSRSTAECDKGVKITTIDGRQQVTPYHDAQLPEGYDNFNQGMLPVPAGVAPGPSNS